MSAIIHAVILHTAALLVPRHERSEWLAEWTAELWYISQNRGPATIFCLGAFQDAMWFRRNPSSSQPCRRIRLQSPVHCVLILLFIAAVGFYSIARLPHQNPGRIVTIGTKESQSLDAQRWLELIQSPQPRIAAFASYQAIPEKKDNLSLARASANLFDVLGIPLSTTAIETSRREGMSALILRHGAWRKHFKADPQIVGRVVDLGGTQVRIAGIVSDISWRPPGHFDGWLIDPSGIPPTGEKTFVVARMTPDATNVPPYRRWRIQVERAGGAYDRYICTPITDPARQSLLNFLWIATAAFLVVPATTFVSLGHVPPEHHSARRWTFLAFKVACILFIVYCGSVHLMYNSTSALSANVQIHAMIWGSVFSLRWALIDQRRRCPVCLRILDHPARVGEPSHIFLNWGRTELACGKGHGLLHVPQLQTSWSDSQRWVDLDRSWSVLFTPVARSRPAAQR